MIKLLHTADLHLDWAFPSLPASRRALRRHEIIGVFYQIITLAIERRVQAVVIAGDLFQSPAPPQEARSAVITGFTRLADHGIPVFLAPGHEEGRLQILERLELPGNVCLVGGSEATVSNLLTGLTVYGFQAGMERDQRPMAGFKKNEQPGVHVGVLHGTYQGPDFETQMEVWHPIPEEDVARAGLDYLALGHHHEFFTSTHGITHIAYPGTPAHLSFGQEALRGAILVSLGEGAPQIERAMLKDRLYREFGFDLNKITFADVLSELEAKVNEEACARVVLTGTVDDEIDFFEERIMEKFGNAFFYLETVDRTEISLPAPGDTIQDLFVRRFRTELADAEMTPAERAVHEYAFRAGMIALKGGRL